MIMDDLQTLKDLKLDWELEQPCDVQLIAARLQGRTQACGQPAEYLAVCVNCGASWYYCGPHHRFTIARPWVISQCARCRASGALLFLLRWVKVEKP